MARLFDGASSEYLLVTTSLITGYPFTMSAWVYVDDTPGDGDTIVSVGDASTNDYFWALRTTGLKALVTKKGVDGGTITSVESVGSLSLNTWHHVAGYMPDDTNATVFLDGVSTSNTGNPGAPSAFVDHTSIGALRLDAAYNPFSGRIAEVAIWDGVQLTASEIGGLAAGFVPSFIRPQSLTAYWPLIRDEDQDRVGGYDMTAYNTPTVGDHPPVIYPASVYQGFGVAAAPPAGISIPIAMRHYRQLRI